LLIGGRSVLAQKFGIYVPITVLSPYDVAILVGVLAAAVLMGFVPAAQAYRRTLSDGLQIRV
jgi:putative ABC transport system permease protein